MSETIEVGGPAHEWTWESVVAQAQPGPMPTTPRLLEGLQNTLATIAAQLDDRGRHSLSGAMVVVNELMLRHDRAFFARLYKNLRDLAAKAAATLRSGSVAILPPPFDHTCDYDVAAQAIEAALSHLDQTIHNLIDRGDEGLARAFQSLGLALESEFQSHRTQQARANIETRSDVSIFSQEQLQAYLGEKLPERGLRVVNFRELVGGYQKKTALFATVDNDGLQEEFVIRAEKEKPFLILDAGAIPNEFALVAQLFKLGLPVAEPVWLETDPDRLGTRFMVSRRVPGTSLGSGIAAGKLDEKVARELVQILARIHQTTIDDELRSSVIGHGAAYPTLADNTRAILAKWRHQPYMDRGETSIALSRVYDWLVTNVPEEDGPARLLHVDYGPHNVLVDGDRVSGVVDWESARIGDPAEDLGYMMQNFQGQFDRSKVLEWYREAGGDAISEFRLRYFDVFSGLKMLVGPLSAGAFYEHNRDAAIDWCVMALLYGQVNRAVEGAIAAAEATKSLIPKKR